jgi:tetratricopeptide (TPR) repeat protein
MALLTLKLPDYLVTQVRDGNVVLFLGSGATREALDARNKKPPTAPELAKLLAKRFLGNKYADYPLNQVAEYAISESDLGAVQSYIRDLFIPFQPSAAHKLMVMFRWYGLATTNYDQIIETAYSDETALKDVKPMIENTDRVEDYLRDPNALLLLKLHGCTSRISNLQCPLILTTEQYIQYREGRERLFDVLRTWAYEHTVVFVGHSLQDPDIRTVLLELSKIGDFRPRNYVVAPDVDEIKAKFWEARHVTPLKGTFLDFMHALDSSIAPSFRTLASFKTISTTTPISAKFKVANVTISKVVGDFMLSDVEYVNSIVATDTVDPKLFYKGVNPGFAAVEQGLDIRRELGDSILSDYFLRDSSEPSDGTEVVLIKAHAGAGKTVLLHRIAWDAAREYDRICLVLKPSGIINTAALQELIALCRERIFLFVDDAADRVRELQALFKNIAVEGKLLTVLLVERMSEWNTQAQAIMPFVTDEYELKYLTSQEIDSLLAVLEKNDALGTLAHLTPDQRRDALAARAGRQLLVALHEATLGRPFEEILIDEFKNITPYEAQRIYLTICVLNRLNSPVRAGIIARIHHIAFEQFKAQFFGPLEHVVFAEYDKITRDYLYRTRHPHIADIVFLKILGNTEERFDVYVRTLKALNLAFTTDWHAFWDLIRARSILQLFPAFEMGKALYRAAQEMVGEDPHLLHQMALYEMNRPNGSLLESARLLDKAAKLAPYDFSIKHSIAEHRLRSAESSRTELEQEKNFKEAKEISLSLISSEKTDSYAYHTLVKIGVKKVEEALRSNRPAAEIEKLIKEAEASLADASQKFPGDAYLLESEANFARALSDNERVRETLERAFAANTRSSIVALRLAQIYEEQGKPEKSRDILEKALFANPNEQKLHYAFAKTLINIGTATGEELAYHLKRSFTEGDSRYDAQLLYGRQLFINGDIEQSRLIFKRLRQVRLGPELRNRPVYVLSDIFHGRVARREVSYCFIARDGSGDWIYLHCRDVDEETWKQITFSTRLQFKVAFSLAGPKAFDVVITAGASGDSKGTQMGLFKASPKT